MPNYFPEWRLFRCFSNFRSTNDVFPTPFSTRMNFYQATGDKFQWPVSRPTRWGASMGPSILLRGLWRKRKKKKSASSEGDTGRDNYSDFSKLDNQSGIINSHRETGRIIDSVYQFVSARSATLFSSLI